MMLQATVGTFWCPKCKQPCPQGMLMCLSCAAGFCYRVRESPGEEGKVEAPMADAIHKEAQVDEPTARGRVFPRCLRAHGLGSVIKRFARAQTHRQRKFASFTPEQRADCATKGR